MRLEPAISCVAPAQRFVVGLLAALLLSSQMALAQFSQQGSKLVGTGATGAALQGSSVALSADGNTAIVGGPHDSAGTGARGSSRAAAASGPSKAASWSARGRLALPMQGSSVALSADGNTAIVGGTSRQRRRRGLRGCTRAAAVSGPSKASKLVGTGAIGTAQQGYSVSLSADGNTAIVGGFGDNGYTGAAWVFTRSGGVWTQQGSKLVGTGATGPAQQGNSVALSSDGNTAIVGGHSDNGLHRGCVGLHPQQRCLEPARQQAGRHGSDWSRPAWHLRLAVRRRQHGHRRRVSRQRCVGLHAQRRCLDPARQQAGRHGSDWSRRTRHLRLAIRRRQHGDRRWVRR